MNVAKVEKTIVYSIRLNPKCFNNRQSAGKLRIGETSTTILEWKYTQVGGSGGVLKLINYTNGYDIVYAHMKV